MAAAAERNGQTTFKLPGRFVRRVRVRRARPVESELALRPLCSRLDVGPEPPYLPVQPSRMPRSNMVNGKSGVDPSLYEGSGGPAPGNLQPGADGNFATPSIPTCQEPPSEGC